MILITGATGLVGSHLALQLLQSGERVRALKRRSSNLHLIESIFAHHNASVLLQQIDWVEGDLLDLGALEDAMQNVTTVYHAAALISFESSKGKELFRVNAEGTANMVNLCLDLGIKKLCYISSIAALGKTTDGSLITEELHWKKDPSHSVYAISKYTAEREVWRGMEEGLNAVILNPGFIVGYGKSKQGSLQLFDALSKNGSWFTNGVTGYVDVRDVAAAAVRLTNERISGKRFILVSDNLTYREVFDSILTAWNRKTTSTYASPFLLGIGWRLEKLLTIITNRTPRITKETSRAAHEINRFDGSSITCTLTDFKYRRATDYIPEAAAFYGQ
jgi:dihydroflavonol-4-reductase